MHRNLNISLPIKKDENNNNVTVFTLKIKGKRIFANNMVFKTWSIKDYKQQWCEGLERLKNKNKSCIIQAFVNLPDQNYIGVSMFAIFKKNKTLYLQYRGFMSDEEKKLLKKKPFNIKTCYDFIAPLETHDIHGQELLYWTCEYNEQEIDQLIQELKLSLN